jgi:hypothetical protein
VSFSLFELIRSTGSSTKTKKNSTSRKENSISGEDVNCGVRALDMNCLPERQEGLAREV